MSTTRPDKENYYLDIAQTVAKRGTCIRRVFGAIIVKNDSIVSTGYAGAPRGRKNCCDMQFCMREKLNIPRGERYELCRRMIINAGIEKVVVRDTATEYRVINVNDWIENDDSLTGEFGY